MCHTRQERQTRSERTRRQLPWLVALLLFAIARPAYPQSGQITGTVRDDTGAPLPGVTVELRAVSGAAIQTVTDATGAFRFGSLVDGAYRLSCTLINFATTHREVNVHGESAPVAIVLHFAVNADVTVTARRTFMNLADVEHPEEDLVGIAQAASQGAITAKQLDERPLMRDGEVLETVPGLIVTQHSGEGKANQYFLRGFNLDHGTDFATAGSSNINYVTSLEHATFHAEAGGEDYGRMLAAASPQLGGGHLLAAFEVAHNNGPWEHPDDYRKVNGVIRYSQGDVINGWAITGMAYHGQWNSTDQVAQRAISSGLIGRFGAIDPTDGGHTSRYSASVDWQHGTGQALTKVTAYGLAYDLDLFSNFTYYLDDPVHGDQIEQADHRFVTGGKVTHRRIGQWAGHEMQNTVGVQIRNDDITNVALYHTEARARLETRSQDAVLETTAGMFAQNEMDWTPWLRTLAGIRVDASRFQVDDELNAVNSGTARATLVSPKGGVTLGPWNGTEFYVNAGTGFHSNDARGTTIVRDSDGNPADRVTPLVRARGAEAGLRTVALPHLQSTVTVWALHLDSELVFDGDAGTTEPSRPSTRHGIEWTNYYAPVKWLVFDGDVSWSQARFTTYDPVGQHVPEAVGTVVSAGATVDSYRRLFGSIRWRYFGPRALIEDDSVRSNPTSLVELQAGYRIGPNVKLVVNVFNLFNAPDSDIDYFYTSRLPGEPAQGVDDVHTHPTLPRTARVGLIVGF